ncbi:MAG: transcriptional repressor LexA [Clostridia bacterium]
MTCAKTLEKTVITYKFIKSFVNEKHYSPSVREICASVKFRSTASAQYYLDKLERLGLIRRAENKNRAIELVATQAIEEKNGIFYTNLIVDGDNLPSNANKFSNNDNSNTISVTSIPFFGNVAAGQPLYADVEVDQSYYIPTDFFRCNDSMFLLKVKGESMRDIGILNGDVVLIKSQPTANNGDIIVAQIDNNEVTLKRFYKKTNSIVLHPENETMDDIIVTPDHEFKILGIASGLMRNKI